MKKEGFSLIELLIALFIAAAVFSAIIPLIFNSITANRSAKLKSFAFEGAQKEIESTKNQSLGALFNHNFTVSSVPGSTGTVTIQRPSTDLAEIQSKVTWTFKGKAERVELKTYKYEAAQ